MEYLPVTPNVLTWYLSFALTAAECVFKLLKMALEACHDSSALLIVNVGVNIHAFYFVSSEKIVFTNKREYNNL